MGFYPSLREAEDIAPALRRLARENLALFQRRGGVIPLETAPVYYDRRQDSNYYANVDEILTRGWSDCDGFTGWLLAELWFQNIPAEPAKKYQGRNLYHVFVYAYDEFGHKIVLDPSVWKGMR